jgi:hypothetical protein
MYIEDLIQMLSGSPARLNLWDQKVVFSFSDQIHQNTGFTEKQSNLALKILQKHITTLSAFLKIDVEPFIETPKYKLAIRKTVIDRSIRIVDREILGKSIEVKFPYDESLVDKIKKFKSSTSSGAVWDKDNTAWLFSLNENNIVFLASLASEVKFDFDETFQNFVDQTETIVNEIEKYAPTLAIHDGDLKILNSPKNMPEIDTDDIIEAIFQARQYGVTLWDDNIEQYITSEEFDPMLREFLKNNFAAPTYLKAESSGVFCLETIVKYLSPCLFIIPGGNELTKITQSYTLLKGMDIDDKNMSVLFRLSTENGRNFNDFVKNQGINGPIYEGTKVVFVSGKIPKTVIKSGIKFNSIINLGFDNVHYTLKEFAKNHQNLVFFDVKNIARNMSFV